MRETDGHVDFTVRPIGTVRSRLTRREDAPRQGDEGAPDAWLEIDPNVAEALAGLAVGDELMLLTWFHLADRDVLAVHPRNDPDRSVAGVFATRSPDRPNPIGLHRVTLREIDGSRLRVGPLEVVDGTPIVDLKPVLTGER
jgi:tRNA-Thr(GGU) m(6)t(6)A37 methyltransferase TsaA